MIDHKSITFDKGGCPPVYSGPALLMQDEQGAYCPVMYMRRPKNCPQEVFDEIVKRMSIAFIPGVE